MDGFAMTPEDRFSRLMSLVEDLPPAYNTGVKSLVLAWAGRIKTWPASTHIHHTEQGGWLRHTLEVYDLTRHNAGVLLLQPDGPAHIDLTDIFLAAFLHDFAKLESYVDFTDQCFNPPRVTFVRDKDRWKYIDPETWTIREAMRYGIPMGLEVVNAILMAEGGWSGFARSSTHSNRTGGDVLPLAALIHAADLISATCLGGKKDPQ